MSTAPTISNSEIPGLKFLYRGKVRDIYEIDDDTLLLVATDRLSAFDCILPTPIDRKGAVLTQLSAFWFKMFADEVDSHFITAEFDKMPPLVQAQESLRGRSTLVKRADVFPVECVVRGYLEGSGWKDYKATGKVSGHDLPRGLVQCDRLLEPIFTPATKATTGHDENITGLEFKNILGSETAALLKATSLKLYNLASEYARERGIIVADTKFEFGTDSKGNIMLVDEVITPDSSRFWSAEEYEPGHAQPSFDKQFVREYLESLDWDKTPPAPPLPPVIAEATSQRYLDAYKLLTGNELEI
ncbi:MAG: phosphoribosylaminoimidazolesuccinocarboxamide synthase [Chloracidobacterium sp.]|nr:phosphoribosylaminoimidazolesuccinocarboxamide synthase [Chloracidobacterium sp.]